MPQARWTDKRERQYQHIKQGLKEHGRSEKTSERIAAATVNKDRARAGESETASPSSLRGPSPARRTRDELYSEARKRGIKGRSKMSKAELQRAVGD
jgi:hypothetical protein